MSMHISVPKWLKLELLRNGHADIVWVLAAGPHADPSFGPLTVSHLTSHATNRLFKHPIAPPECTTDEILPHKVAGGCISESELIGTALPAKKASHNES